jgi:hypothetical protein
MYLPQLRNNSVPYKRDWTARKPYYIIKIKEGEHAGRSLVIINERKLVTDNPVADLISTLEEQIATLKDTGCQHQGASAKHIPKREHTTP